MHIINGENLAVMETLRQAGESFHLVELDGPYNAGLEEWDALSGAEYLQHYAQRLEAVKQILDPRGVVFIFGYPEGCAEIKAWAEGAGIFILRRWLTWHVQSTAHNGRKIQTILFFTQPMNLQALAEFREAIKTQRLKMNITIEQAHNETGIGAGLRGGYAWFESYTGKIPTDEEYKTLKLYFDLPDEFDQIPYLASYPALTDIDLITVAPEPALILNDNGLRSKPATLYVRLFRPVIQARKIENPRALILYGGSGNAGIAAEALGYDVTVIEQDSARCQAMEERAPAEIKKWRRKLSQKSFLDRDPLEFQRSFFGSFESEDKK